MRIYRGYTDQEQAGPEPAILVYEEDRPAYKLRQMIVHSPSGMAWGFGGSGPADLALAILADLLREADAIPAHARYDHDIATEIQHTRAWMLHQDFKWQFITPLDQGGGWTITEAVIRDWLAPRLPEVERQHRERRAVALIGTRVALFDVLDYDDDGMLAGYPAPGATDPRRIPLDEVAHCIGPMPDDEED